MPTMEDVTKLRQLELGWNDKIRIEKESRRILTMGEDIRDFLNSSMGLNTPNVGGMSPEGFQATHTGEYTDSPEKDAVRTKEGLSPMKGGGMLEIDGEAMRKSDTFSVIANTFNFQHHEGTDEKIELKMIKCIVTRESLLMKLKHFVDMVEERNPYGEISLKPSAGAKILELMMQIRGATLDYLDNLHRWRLTDKNNDATVNLDNPKVFVWEGYNYTMKIVSDLDFLAEKAGLVAALNQTPEKMRANPLMLPGTLEETADTWVDPALRASMDANNQTSGEFFEERLRLRNAERLLLLEIEVNASFVPPNLHEFSPHASRDTHPSQMGAAGQESPIRESMTNEEYNKMVSWRQEAGEQLMYMDPKNANYLAAQQLMGNNKNNSGYGGQGENQKDSVDKDSNRKKRPPMPQEPQSTWDQQAEIFPEVDVDSGVAFYQDFGERVEDVMIPSEEMGRYDQFLQGDDVMGSFDKDVEAAYGSQFGMIPGQDGVEGTAGETFSRRSRRSGGRGGGKKPGQAQNDDIGAGLGTDSKISLSSSLSIEAVTQYDLDVMANLPRPPRSVILAGAICVIFLSSGNQLPEEVSWEAFCKLAFASNTVSAMNTLDPVGVPAFKVRAVLPFMDRLSLKRGATATMGAGAAGAGQPIAQNTSNNIVDALGSISSQDSLGLDIPLEASDSVEKVFRWVNQVVSATTSGKKRRQKKGSTVLPPVTEPKKVSGDGKAKKARQAQKKTEQSTAASRLMTGGHSTERRARKPKKLGSLDSLWPVHTEILENVYKHPLLLTVLSAAPQPQSGGGTVSSRELLKVKKMLLQVDPLNIAGNGMDLPPERIVVKVYNLVDSAEAVVNVNVREFTLFLYELREKYGSEVSEYYRPASVLWWVENLRGIIVVKARADKKLMVSISKQAIGRHVASALGQYRGSDGAGGGGGQGQVSQQSSMDMPMGSLSTPGEGEVPFEGSSMIEAVRGQGGNHPEPIDLGDWDFFENDLQEPEPMPAQKLSRQEMRKNYDATGQLERGPASNGRSSGGAGRKPTPAEGAAADQSGLSQRQQKEAEHQRQQEEMKQLQQQQRERMRHELPDNLDYGEDVFEDDGEGEFEEEVARAQQISRSISRERPLSAPGSMSAPHSISSLPSRQAADTNDLSRVDSMMDPHYGIDYIAEQSHENSVSMRLPSADKSNKDDDARSDQPVGVEGDGVQEDQWENPEEEIPDEAEPGKQHAPRAISREKTHVEEALNIAFSESQVGTASVDDDADNKSIRSEVSASLGEVVDSLATSDPYANEEFN